MARPKMDETRREQILAAFERCVIRQGLSGTTLADVASEAELPRPLVRYFVGNRGDMVRLLVARMVERAQAELSKLHARPGPRPTAPQLVDFLFDRVFANETSNAIVAELWYLAQRDPQVRDKLRAAYAALVRGLVSELSADPRIVAPRREIEAVAFALLSLAYGEVSFRELGLDGPSHKRVRALAHAMLSPLTSKRGAKP